MICANPRRAVAPPLVVLASLVLSTLAPVASLEGRDVLRREDRRLLFGDRPVQLVGFSYYGLVADRDFDAGAFLEALAACDINLTRFFLILPWPVDPGRPNLLPFARVGDKYDLGRFDPEFFARLDRVTRRAEELGIVCELVLFDRCGLSQGDHLAWRNHPYNAARNINGLLEEGPAGYPPFCQSEGAVARVHAAFARRVVETCGERSNVIYEIMNEPYPQLGPLEKWHAWVARELRGALAGHGGSRVIGSTGIFAAPEIDVVSMHRAGDAAAVERAEQRARAAGRPIIFSDDGDAASMYQPDVTVAAAARALGLGQHFEHLAFTLTLRREVHHRPAARLADMPGLSRANLRALAPLASPLWPRPATRSISRLLGSGAARLEAILEHPEQVARVEARESRDGGRTWSRREAERQGDRVVSAPLSPRRGDDFLAGLVAIDREGRRWPGPAVPVVAPGGRRAALGEPRQEAGLLVIRPCRPDGSLRPATRAGSRCYEVDASRRGKYAYFRLDPRASGDEIGHAAVVEVDFLDEETGARLQLEFDGKAGPYTASTPVSLEGGGKWRGARFLLPAPRFAGRQNDGADFRLSLQGRRRPLALREVRLLLDAAPGPSAPRDR